MTVLKYVVTFSSKMKVKTVLHFDICNLWQHKSGRLVFM
jgi:hypothetical protein